MTLCEKIIGLAKNRRRLANKMCWAIWRSTVDRKTMGVPEHQAASYVLDVCRRMGFVCKLRGKVISGNYNGYKWNVRLIWK